MSLFSLHLKSEPTQSLWSLIARIERVPRADRSYHVKQMLKQLRAELAVRS